MSAVIYLVRHGEVEHHRADVGLTAHGCEQAVEAGRQLAKVVAPGSPILIRYSPVTRVRQTAELIFQSLKYALHTEAPGTAAPVPDEALANVRFAAAPGERLEEPSLLYARLSSPAYLSALPAGQADFYRGFWAGADPMGYWLTHDSQGGAETPEDVLARLLARVKAILAGAAGPERAHWIMVTHSGALRVLLRHALGADPGEPNFCEIVAVNPPLERATLVYREQIAALKFV